MVERSPLDQAMLATAQAVLNEEYPDAAPGDVQFWNDIAWVCRNHPSHVKVWEPRS